MPSALHELGPAIHEDRRVRAGQRGAAPTPLPENARMPATRRQPASSRETPPCPRPGTRGPRRRTASRQRPNVSFSALPLQLLRDAQACSAQVQGVHRDRQPVRRSALTGAMRSATSLHLHNRSQRRGPRQRVCSVSVPLGPIFGRVRSARLAVDRVGCDRPARESSLMGTPPRSPVSDVGPTRSARVPANER